MAKKFEALRAKMSPEALKESRAKAERYRHEMALDELRTARELTQESLAAVLGVKQSTISKLERKADMYLSTLNGIIKAMGGELRVEAVFPDGKVELSQFKAQLRQERRQREERQQREQQRQEREEQLAAAI